MTTKILSCEKCEANEWIHVLDKQNGLCTNCYNDCIEKLRQAPQQVAWQGEKGECILCQYPHGGDFKTCEGCKEEFCSSHAKEFNSDGFCEDCVSEILSEARNMTEPNEERDEG